jgi:DNA repair photolyase
MARVAAGQCRSALDEFLARRVPLQFGGMQDPFSPMERLHGVTARTLDVLREHDYPTLISTKGSLVVEPDYLSRLSDMNVSVRVSAAGLDERHRPAIERDCHSYSEVLRIIQRLASNGIPTTLRLQPIIPGQEQAALKMLTQASAAGVRHVSLEFLKLTVESRDRTADSLSRILGYDLRSYMNARGAMRVGPDFTTGTSHKLQFLAEAKNLARSCNVTIGAGDTELIHLSDGDGCCNGASLMLRGANIFNANFTGILKHAREGERISFDRVMNAWSPQSPISTYLMTDSRTAVRDGELTDWQGLMAARWERRRSVYSPGFFAGVEPTDEVDGRGRTVYRYRRPL